MRTFLFSIVLGLAVGCTGSGTGQVSYSAEIQTPPLVEISPGVQVVADYDEPVFYSDNYYWRYDGGTWYRSHDHRRDWVRVEVVPDRIRTIQRPEMYVHYHGDAHANVEHPYVAPEVREHRDETPEVRDHRDEVVTPVQPAPVVREHETVVEPRDSGEYRKDVREHDKDAKEQRKQDKEHRKDAKEQRKQDKAERKEAEHERHEH